MQNFEIKLSYNCFIDNLFKNDPHELLLCDIINCNLLFAYDYFNDIS